MHQSFVIACERCRSALRSRSWYVELLHDPFQAEGNRIRIVFHFSWFPGLKIEFAFDDTTRKGVARFSAHKKLTAQPVNHRVGPQCSTMLCWDFSLPHICTSKQVLQIFPAKGYSHSVQRTCLRKVGLFVILVKQLLPLCYAGSALYSM